MRSVGIGAIGMALVTAFGSPARSALAQDSSGPRPTVAVMHFNNAALIRNADFAHLGAGIADVLITELQGNPHITVVERDNVRRLIEEQDLDTTARVDKETAVRIGKILGVQHMLFGGFLVDGRGRMRLDVRAVNVETSKVEYVVSKSDHSDNVIDLIEDVAAEMNRGMRLPPHPARQRPAERGKRSDQLRALQFYANGIMEQERGNTRKAAEHFRAALAQYPGYELARQRLAQLETSG